MPMTVGVVSRESMLPLYYQLAESLRAQIVSGTWKPGDKIPTETELCQEFKLSRTTVRQAIQALVYEGLLTRQQGRGTFVARPRLGQDLVTLTSFTEEMRKRGRRAGGRVLEQRVIQPSAEVAEKLHIPQDRPVVKIRRLRLADGEPMGVQTSFLPEELVPGLEREPLQDRSLYDVLRRKYRLRLVRAQEVYSAVLLDRATARLLGAPGTSAALAAERVTFNEHDRPVEVTKSLFLGDRYQLQAELRSP
ncbi:MAG: GntR family transcriptional regulator [Armatimonadota bacterium]|nr:GntR family transcriptional regulator [Armatimonadota bacterium]